MIRYGLIPKAMLIVACGSLIVTAERVTGQAPPVLRSCFPAGAQIGQSVDIRISGDNLENLRSLVCSIPAVECSALGSKQIRLSVPPEITPGYCDIWLVGDGGISAPYSLVLGNRDECREVDPNDTESQAQPIRINTVVNGRIDKPSDTDCFRFTASQDQRVVIECRAERINSSLRAILEVVDENGRRLAVNRGYFGTDPLIDFRVPANGDYIVKLTDLIDSTSDQHIYRLAIDSGPRVAFAVPSVVERNRAAQITLFGWDLTSHRSSASDGSLDSVAVELPASLTTFAGPSQTRLLSTQSVIAGQSFDYHLLGSHAPVVIGLTDIPVVQDVPNNHSPGNAQELAVPSEVSGQLAAGDEQDWFAFSAHRGEVIYIEALGDRVQSPIDLQITIGKGADSGDSRELAHFRDQVRNIGGEFRTDHLDPVGRWVCPADGRYLIGIRNVIGGLQPDQRRIYRLSLRREEPDVHVVAVPRGTNVRRNGRVLLDLLAIRRRGLNGSVRVSAVDLPSGVDFPDVWLGPNVDRTLGVVSADRNAVNAAGEVKLEARPELPQCEPVAVIGGAVLPSTTPYSLGRLTPQIRMAVAGDASIRITADAHQTVDHHIYGILLPRHSPGGIVDVAVQVDRENESHQADVKLTAIGLPDAIDNQIQTIPQGQPNGYISFYLPKSLPIGHYSFAVQAETTISNADNKTESVKVCSNPVTIHVEPAAFHVGLDPFAVTKARRGEIFQVGYTVKRVNGFIGKTHTELASAGVITDVPGLRGRGVTFVGQANRGTIQIEVNGDAQLGQQRFVRLFAVGVVEDQPVYHGSSRFLTLEIMD